MMRDEVERQRIEALFHEALQHATDEREQFLKMACGPNLRSVRR